jgi:hypothetical protein
MRTSLNSTAAWGGSTDRACTECGSPIRVGRGEVDRSRDSRTGEVVVRWRWRCGCGRVRTLKRLEVGS